MLIVITALKDPSKKIQAIKELRARTGLGFKEAKYMIDDIVGSRNNNTHEYVGGKPVEIEVDFYPDSRLFTYHTSARAEQMQAHADNWFDSTKGYAGSGFVDRLFALATVCDLSNLAKLREAFPIEIDAFIKARG